MTSVAMKRFQRHQERVKAKELAEWSSVQAELSRYGAPQFIRRQAALCIGKLRDNPLLVICGAKTRKGTRCRCRAEPGHWRCKFHGGKSTGPKTPEGRRRAIEAMQQGRMRWQALRAREMGCEASPRADRKSEMDSSNHAIRTDSPVGMEIEG